MVQATLQFLSDHPVILGAIKVVVVFTVLAGAIAFLVYVERKVLAFMQARLGPMRVGPWGLLQAIADPVKLMLKEDIIPAGADRGVFLVAPVIGVIAAFTAFALIPFASNFVISDLNIGILFVLGFSSLGIYGIILGGWASNSHYPLLGALRSSAQLVSYEVAAGIAIVGVILLSNSLSLVDIVKQQQNWGVWNVFLQPLAFFVYLVASVAETNRSPFDLPEAESELTAGFHTEYSGFRWSLFFLAEYSAMIAVSSIAVTLWLGGWLRPFPNALSGPTWDLVFSLFPGLTFLALAAMCFYSTARMPKHPYFRIQIIGLAGFGVVLALIGLILFFPPVRIRIQDIYWFIAKVAAFMYLYIWYRGTFPRYRFDQLMKVGWKILLPMGLGVLILTATVGLWPLIQQTIWHP